MKQRDFYLDNICSLLIIHMIYTCHIAHACGHCLPTIIKAIGTSLFFFMSWFFFKGGMVHKIGPFKEIFKKSVKRLFVPYVIFLLVGLLLDGILKFATDETLTLITFLKGEVGIFASTAIIWPTGVSWFLLSLFIVRLTFNFFISKAHPILLVSFFLFLGYGMYLIQCYVRTYGIQFAGYTLHRFPVYLGNICHGITLYSLGYYLKDRQFNRSLFVTAFLLYIAHFFIPAGIDFRANNSYGKNYIWSAICGMAGCIVINNLFRRYLNRKVRVFTHIGCNSMVYYLIHYPIIFTTIELFLAPVKDDDFMINFSILSFVVTILLIVSEYLFRIKKLRFIIGG